MKTLALATLFIAACAGRATTTTTPLRGDARGFPALTSEGRVAVASSDERAIRATPQGRAETKVHLCVAPSGAVDQVNVVRSSGNAGYDRAVVESVQGWKFESSAAAEAPRCTRMSVVYDAI